MNIAVTIPRQLLQQGELVIIPRSEYEEFLQWQKIIKTFKPTAAEKKDLRNARKDFIQGKHITLAKLSS